MTLWEKSAYVAVYVAVYNANFLPLRGGYVLILVQLSCTSTCMSGKSKCDGLVTYCRLDSQSQEPFVLIFFGVFVRDRLLSVLTEIMEDYEIMGCMSQCMTHTLCDIRHTGCMSL